MLVKEIDRSLTDLEDLGLIRSSEQREIQTQLSLVSEVDEKMLATTLLDRGLITPFQAKAVQLGRVDRLLIGSFLLEEELGQGGMGCVFKARNRVTNVEVALKVIREEYAQSPMLVARFLREMKAVFRLHHPNVIRALHADKHDSSVYLVMELLSGGCDLLRWIQECGKARTSISEACNYVCQAAWGLHHAHEQGIIHRDVKPSNLYLSTGLITVLDFGIARLQETLSNRQGVGDTLTQDGVPIGTPDYMPPEQADNPHEVDARSDVYALGCTLYHLVSGQVPFPGGNVWRKLMRHQQDRPPDLTSLRPDVPQEITNIANRMMAKKPEDRFDSLDKVATALQAFA